MDDNSDPEFNHQLSTRVAGDGWSIIPGEPELIIHKQNAIQYFQFQWSLPCRGTYNRPCGIKWRFIQTRSMRLQNQHKRASCFTGCSEVSTSASRVKLQHPGGPLSCQFQRTIAAASDTSGYGQVWYIDKSTDAEMLRLAWEAAVSLFAKRKKRHVFPFLIYPCKHFSSVHAKKEKIAIKKRSFACFGWTWRLDEFERESAEKVYSVVDDVLPFLLD